MPLTRISGNALAAVILAAVVGSFFINHQTAINAAASQNDALVTGCLRSSVQKSLGATGWYQAAATRRAAGTPADLDAASRYEAVAQGMIDTIPAPPGKEGSAALGESRFIDGDRPHFVITKKAQKLQLEGCKRVYPKP